VHFPVHLLIPLVCGFTYVVGALCMKRAAEHGAGVWRSTFVANGVMALSFAPAWFWRAPLTVPLAEVWWHPVVTALLFMLAQLCLFLAISRGDVSVTTPVMGTKSVWVALFSSVLLAKTVPVTWWIAAGLGAVAVALLGLGRGGQHRRLGFSVGCTLVGALLFSLCDTLTQKWVPALGVARYLPMMMVAMAVMSVGFVPFFRAGLGEITGNAWRWLLLGSMVMALTNAGILTVLGTWGDATAVNIVFSSRGLWSVVLVRVAGHWFGNAEGALGWGVLGWRLVGAALMVVAIVLVVT
jgi:drug/metabolite transporter (DMT)-like permease